MKKHILFLICICSLTFVKAQQQFNCYYVQEFLWNSQTLAYDNPVERNETTSFKIDAQKKQFIQVFKDDISLAFQVKSEAFDANRNIQFYTLISPTTGSVYIYKINVNDKIIEVSTKSNNEEVLLKKYLFKD